MEVGRAAVYAVVGSRSGGERARVKVSGTIYAYVVAALCVVGNTYIEYNTCACRSSSLKGGEERR